MNSIALYQVYLSWIHADSSSCHFQQSYIDPITQKVSFLEQLYNESCKPPVKDHYYLHSHPEKMDSEGQPVRRAV